MAERSAQVTWQGDLMSGSGEIHEVPSGAFGPLQVTWASRAEDDQGDKTSPEELLAAAHAGCYATSLAGELTQAGSPPEQLDITSNVVMDEVAGEGHVIVESQLRVRARVAGIDEESFRRIAAEADAGCPFSKLIKASAKVSIDAELEG